MQGRRKLRVQSVSSIAVWRDFIEERHDQTRCRSSGTLESNRREAPISQGFPTQHSSARTKVVRPLRPNNLDRLLRRQISFLFFQRQHSPWCPRRGTLHRVSLWTSELSRIGRNTNRRGARMSTGANQLTSLVTL